MERTLYAFNSSQDIINLQTKYSLFGRVANIVFSTEVEGGFDKKLMKEAINLAIQRNDCLRITFVKKGKETLQYFEESRRIEEIPEVKFETNSAKTKFIGSFRRDALKIYKGEVLKVVFGEEIDGNQSIYFKISHYIADTYAIGVIISDIFKIYASLRDKAELPEMPGSFEAVLKKDLEYKADTEARRRDEEFFKDYYEGRHPEHPTYCGIHGDAADKWLKVKKEGKFSMPYFFVKCDTEGYRFTIPGAVCAKAKEWCAANQIPMSTFFFTACNIAASLTNGKQERLTPLMLLDCRGTKAERRCGGTKVQSMSVYSTIDYSRSFNENIQDAFKDQNDLYKHTRLSYLEVEALQHKLWNYSMLSQVTWCAFSYIPFDAPEGIKFQVHSNGKGALPAYIALMASPRTEEIEVVYDIQTQLTTGPLLAEFQNRYVHVIEAVLSAPEAKLDDIL